MRYQAPCFRFGFVPAGLRLRAHGRFTSRVAGPDLRTLPVCLTLPGRLVVRRLSYYDEHLRKGQCSAAASDRGFGSWLAAAAAFRGLGHFDPFEVMCQYGHHGHL